MSSELVTFGDLYKEPSRNGLTRPKAVRGQGVKMVNMGELFAYPIIKNIDMDRVPLSDKEREKSLLHTGDLLFARQSLVLEGAGKCSIFFSDDEDVTFESHLIRVRLNHKKASPLFYFYYFQSYFGKTAIEGIVEQGAGAAGIRGTDLATIQVNYLPLPEQRAIAHILGTLDDKIENNRRMNATLEAMAQALFKSWFVDFDPVRAKAEGREPEGMDAATAALFPDRLVDSELGEVPEGWECQTLAEAFEINPKRQLKKGQTACYADMASVPTSGHSVEAWIPREFTSGTKFINGDTLLARITPCLENGKTAFVDFLPKEETGWGSTEFIVLKPNPPLPEFYGYLLCRHPDFREFAIQSMTGTSGRQRVQPAQLGHYQIAKPSTAVGDAFGKIIEPIRIKISQNSQESKNLSHLRDTLLPKLISGELRVPEAEDMAEAVL